VETIGEQLEKDLGIEDEKRKSNGCRGKKSQDSSSGQVVGKEKKASA